ncbi:MAG: helix-hairpin-helix domain-containing protein, partial [Spirochaetaceae bacterium]|nr:helix-hairpin-helix domain-containing protein [Spirochaetaceae bacterium]
PGIRTGTKCAFLDDTGKYLGCFVIYNHKAEEAKRLILGGVKNYDIQLIAVGNGTGSRDVQEIVAAVIAENNLEVLYTVVDEDGASVYSASDIAREEFPDLDLTIRGAISIGRRLQDPLAELVKIDPKSIGVGLSQHDVNQKKLAETLDEVVSSVVNNVGVNLNTASVSLLRYVSGINGSLAKKIVKYRDEKGKITSREELCAVPGMGPKSYEQCAGFLKIPESGEVLDNTWVHPENYAAARIIWDKLRGGNSGGTATITGNLSPEDIKTLRETQGVGDTTINDIVEELKKPNRDPREGYPKPIMRKGLTAFEDLAEGMTITGKIKNVVDFGAFVDLGIKETALVHISEMSDHFVKDPIDTVKVGDVLEFRIISLDRDRRRIGLSRKSPGGAAPARGHHVKGGGEHLPREKPLEGTPEGTSRELSGDTGGKKRTVTVKKTGEGTYGQGPLRDRERPPKDDDGTMYNPFAEAFRKIQKKKERL